MNSTALSNALQQLISQVPIFAVFLGGFVVALVFWQHCPLSSLLTVAALFILGVTIVVQPFATQLVIQQRVEEHWTTAQLGVRLTMVAASISVVRAVAYGLLLGAVFAGRRAAPPAPHPYAPPATRIL